MTIDLGLLLEKVLWIREGGAATLKHHCSTYGTQIYLTAVDNRYGCVIITEILNEFANVDLDIK